MNAYRPLLIAALASCGFAIAAPVFTSAAGYVSITCPANSDTIVGLPLRTTSTLSGVLSANPNTTTPGSATLTLAGSPSLATNEFAGAYYVKFKDTTPTAAAGDGQWFSITANGANTLTVDLNGGTIAAVSGAQLEVLKYWTLAELFPPADCTTDPATTGNAIVASTSDLAEGRRTQVLIPNLVATGINIAPSATYFVSGGAWRKVGDVLVDSGSVQLWPDVYFIIRNPLAVTSATNYTVSGEVEMGTFVLPLGTLASGRQDNFIGMPRAADVTLNQLNLANTSAFVSSTSIYSGGRKDELLVFNNNVAGLNKSAAAIYFYHANNGWRKQSGGNADFGNAVIPAGCGFIIRKAISDGSTQSWSNTSPY